MRFSESFFFAGSREPRDIYINVHSTGGQGDPGHGRDLSFGIPEMTVPEAFFSKLFRLSPDSPRRCV